VVINGILTKAGYIVVATLDTDTSITYTFNQSAAIVNEDLKNQVKKHSFSSASLN
jgi:hypothetical protein